jgi:hypothetical protein
MPSGAQAMCNYGYELVAFKTLAASHAKTFGEGVKISTQDIKRNFQRIYGLGGRSATALTEGRYEGALSVDFELASPWWLYGVMGTWSSSGVGPYTHTFGEANVPPSCSIEADIDLATDAVIHYLGCICNEARISFQEGAPAHVSLSFVYATETKATSTLVAQTAETEATFNMGYCSIEVPDATAIADVRKAELTITNNAALHWGLGSVLPSQFTMGQREYSVSVENFYDVAATFQESIYGQATGPTTLGSDIATVEMRATNSGATTSERTYSFMMSNAVVNTHSLPRDVNEPIYETIEIIPQTLSVVVTNNTLTMP